MQIELAPAVHMVAFSHMKSSYAGMWARECLAAKGTDRKIPI